MFTAVFLAFLTFIPGAHPTFAEFVARVKAEPGAGRQKIVEQYLSEAGSTPIIENDSIVNFIWYGKAASVLINGNLEKGWSKADTLEAIQCGDSTLYIETRTVPDDARLDYQVVVDGKYNLDPRNPLTSPSGYGLHSVVWMPKHQAVPELKYRADVSHGSLDTLQFATQDVSLRPRRVIVYKPAGYEKFSEMPVILMHDGEDALNYGEAANVLDNLVAEGKMVPVIGVFVPAVEREAEYDGMKTYEYAKALCGELMPMIEAKYRVSKDPLKHATVGASDGGHITLDLFFGHPETFGCAGGQSSTVTPVIHELEYSAVDHHLLSPQARLYIDVGTYDIPEFHNTTFYDLNREFDTGLTAEHVPHIFRVVHEGHEWGSWRERWPEMFQYFFPKN